MFHEIVQKLFQVVLTVFVIKVYNESQRSNSENLYFFGLAVKHEISNEIVFGGYFLVELKVIYNSFFIETS